MDKTNESKKCFCARCFLPIDAEDKVDIEGQNFHRICSMCCVCRTIPTSLKMFYGHVFCDSCFKSHVMSRLKGDNRVQSNSWWMQWAPTAKGENTENGREAQPSQSSPEEPTKRSICARCLQPVDECNKVQIGDQSFHNQCAQCYFCHAVPKSNVKIYYGQLFCEDCFHRYVLSRNRDNPSEFFRTCFESWQNNTQFAENMKDFMSSSKDSAPFVFMMGGQQPPFCRCGTGPQEWFQPNEPKKSATATPTTISNGEESDTVELSCENRTEASEIPESSAIEESAVQENLNVGAAEKIEKLTKYLHEMKKSEEKLPKKWKNFIKPDEISVSSDLSYFGWINIQDSKKSPMDCPKCLWQCGPIFVSSDYFQKKVVCGDN